MRSRLRCVFGAVVLLLSLLILADWVSSYFVTKRCDVFRDLHIRFIFYRTLFFLDVNGHFVHMHYSPRSEFSAEELRESRPIPIRRSFTIHPITDEYLSGTIEQWTGRPAISNGFGFWYSSEDTRDAYGKFWRINVIAVPHWFLFVVTAAVSRQLLWPIYTARRRRLRGLCVKCGYDLRASKDRCPECGVSFRRDPKTTELEETPPPAPPP